MKLVDNAILKIDEFPTLPTIYSKLQDVMNNPRSGATDVANVISSDQSASSKILKISNSPIFGYKSQIKTITQAVVLLGQKEIKNIIITISILDSFKGLKANSYLNPVDFWKYSIATGVMSRLIAKKLNLENLEEFFLAGILHSIGKLLFLKMIPQKFTEAIQYSFDNKISTKETEKDIIGYSNITAAKMLCEKWRLPKYITNCVANFDKGEIDGRNTDYISIIHISSFLVQTMSIGNSGEFRKFPLKRELLVKLGFEDKDFTSILPKFYNQYLDSSNLLLKV